MLLELAENLYLPTVKIHVSALWSRNDDEKVWEMFGARVAET